MKKSESLVRGFWHGLSHVLSVLLADVVFKVDFTTNAFLILDDNG